MQTDFYKVKTGRFYRFERIKNPGDVQKLFKKGRKFSTQGAKLFILDNNSEINRVCFSLPRGFGTAVERNHSKRLSREVFRILKTKIKVGYDFIFLVYSADDTFEVRMKQMNHLFLKACLFKNEKDSLFID